jgi:hypothetical protein
LITNDLESKWNKQQKKRFECFGDHYYQEPNKYYHAVGISPPVANLPLPQPVANLPLQQPVAKLPLQQRPITIMPLQQPLANVPLLQPVASLPLQQPLPLQPAVLPAPLPAGPQLSPPLIVVTPPLPECTPESCKRVLQTIPEEDEPVEPRRQRTGTFNFLHLWLHHQQNHSSWQQKWKDQQEDAFNQKWTRGFGTLLNVWPFHLIEVDDQGRSRFWLTLLEKDRLQSLALLNLFPLTWSAPGCPHNALSRCRKTLTELY